MLQPSLKPVLRGCQLQVTTDDSTAEVGTTSAPTNVQQPKPTAFEKKQASAWSWWYQPTLFMSYIHLITDSVPPMSSLRMVACLCNTAVLEA